MDNAPHDKRFATDFIPVGKKDLHDTKYLVTDISGKKHILAAEDINIKFIKTCPRCLFDSTFAEIGETQCNYCDIHDQLVNNSKPENLEPDIFKIQRDGRKNKYDCIIGISGGLDSSTLLYLAVKKWDLRPLVIHFDNGFNNAQAEANMKSLTEKLNVNSITFRLDKHEYENLNLAFLEAGVPDADIPNDIAMTKLMYDTADKHGIKWILNGHDFRTEGSTPAKWTYMDARYIQDVYQQFTNTELENYPLFTFNDQIKYAFKGIKQIRPFHYNAIGREKIEQEMKSFIGWQDYGPKHCENIYTEYVGAHLLPVKFGIDKRIVYLSARIRSGTIDKEEARLIMQTKTLFDFTKFTDKDFLARVQCCEKSPIQSRDKFKKYNFKKWKFVIWIMAKLKIVPYTFFKKYTQ